ncbi:MAG: energy-coupling factor transporter transmembrane protein EcfT [Propionibacteriales bacterium]|nr:energy-coupling factor transporter transmembrane protein EcfT [Propionibacteriales bacterium]
MLSLYLPGDGVLHRMPPGPKILTLLALVLGVSLLPAAWWAACAAAAMCVIAYAVAGLGDGAVGMRQFGRQVFAIRWIAGLTIVGQLIFLGPEPAVANTARVCAAIIIAALLVLTTRVTTLLDTLERALRPLEFVRLDPQRAALLLTVTITTVPVLAGLARQVREAQRARGSSGGLRTFAVPFLVMALKHADELGDALAARGVG